MAIEIERKFLVEGDGWLPHVIRTEQLRQGYLSTGGGVTVRIRTVNDAAAFITIKGGGSALARAEFEYAIPIEDARQLFGYCANQPILKRRHILDLPGGEWIVDAFEGRHLGLTLAEVELKPPFGALDLPAWLGREVTSDPHYYNSTLSAAPSGGEI